MIYAIFQRPVLSTGDRVIQAEDFLSGCKLRGYTFLTGVPCSLLGPLIAHSIHRKDLDYVAASSEGEAVGIAAGAHLAGRKAVVLCQNSGLGNMVNPLTSLNFPFRIPALVIIGWRGEPGLKDEPQHELMGMITGSVLDVIKVPWALFPTDPATIDTTLDKAEQEMEATGLPFALIMKRGAVANTDLGPDTLMGSAAGSAPDSGEFVSPYAERMSRLESIRTLRETISPEDAVIATTGKTGRELFSLEDSNNQFYVVGSMGCATGIGFGIQHVLPEQRVIVLEGDGSTLMKMGTLATIGYYQPPKLINIILDNEAYDSTGGQYTVSPAVDFCKVAAACGFRHCWRTDTEGNLKRAIKTARELSGPSLIHVKIACGSAANLPRPKVKPFQVKERFMQFLSRERSNP